MSKKYFNSNPIAQKLYNMYNLNENENVDKLLDKVAVVVLDSFKKIVFDLSSNKSRNPDVFREKLSDLNDSKNISNLISKMKDYAEEASLIDSKYSKVKQMYLKGLSKITDSLKRMVEIDPSLGNKAMKKIESLSDTLMGSVDRIAVERMKRLNESSSDNLYESISIGFEGRADTLRKKLVNLISESK
jgi:hypothetical protein